MRFKLLILGLPHDTFWTAYINAASVGCLVDDEMEKIWEEVIVAYF